MNKMKGKIEKINLEKEWENMERTARIISDFLLIVVIMGLITAMYYLYCSNLIVASFSLVITVICATLSSYYSGCSGRHGI